MPRTKKRPFYLYRPPARGEADRRVLLSMDAADTKILEEKLEPLLRKRLGARAKMMDINATSMLRMALRSFFWQLGQDTLDRDLIASPELDLD